MSNSLGDPIIASRRVSKYDRSRPQLPEPLFSHLNNESDTMTHADLAVVTGVPAKSYGRTCLRRGASATVWARTA